MGMAGNKIDWQQVTDLISFRRLKDDTYKICAKYKFESNPETKFNVSNKLEAFQYSHSEYRDLIRKMENGQHLLHQQLLKNIKDGGFEVLSAIETEKVLKKPHNFIKNYLIENLKSKSTPIRTILDPSSYDPKTQTSINAILSKLPMKQNPITLILMSFMIYAYPLSMDIKSAFHNIEMTKEHQNFQLIAGFDTSFEDWEKHPIVIRCLSLVYGNSQSCQLLEAGLRGLCKLKKLKGSLLKVISEFRLIDNFLSSYNKKEEMVEMKNQVELIMQEFNLPLKEYDTSAAGISNIWQDEENIQNLLGVRWSKNEDFITPNWQFNLAKKRRGKRKKERNVTLSNIDSQKWTRRTLLRLIMSIFDPLGILSNHFIINFKILFSKVCKQCPAGDYNTDIGSKDITVRNEIIENVKKLLEFKCSPLKRNFLDEDKNILYLVTSGDWSSVGYGSTIHLISENKSGLKRSRLIRAANKIRDDTAPMNELHSLFLAGKRLLQTVISLNALLPMKIFNKINYYDLSDSQSTFLQLLNKSKPGVHLTLIKKS